MRVAAATLVVALTTAGTAVGRLLAGTDVRVIRVAGPDGSGDYRVHWIPLRVGRTWRW